MQWRRNRNKMRRSSTCGRTTRTKYGPNADRIEYMKGHPNAKLLTVRWVVTEKARLVVREYNTWRTQEFFRRDGEPDGAESDSHDSS